MKWARAGRPTCASASANASASAADALLREIPMSTEQAFLADIVAHPDDDGPRLIFADWLDEHGQADRAAFIRAQIERLRLKEGDDRQEELRRREGYLLLEEQEAWRQRLGSGKAELKLVRGFV